MTIAPHLDSEHWGLLVADDGAPHLLSRILQAIEEACGENFMTTYSASCCQRRQAIFMRHLPHLCRFVVVLRRLQYIGLHKRGILGSFTQTSSSLTQFLPPSIVETSVTKCPMPHSTPLKLHVARPTYVSNSHYFPNAPLFPTLYLFTLSFRPTS